MSVEVTKQQADGISMSIMDNRSKKSRSIKEKKNGFKIVERKKISNSISHFFYNLSKTEQAEELKKALEKRSKRLRFCGEKKHILTINGIAHNLYSHKCRDRQCIDCQAIKSYVWQNKIAEVNEKLKAELKADEYSFLFLTFTVKNPAVKDLKATLKLMNKAIYQLFKHKKYIVGGIRTTEITRGKSARNECHPHFHMLLIVHNSFFEGKTVYEQNGKHTLPDVEMEFSQAFGRYLSMYADDFKLKFDWNDYAKTDTKGPRVEVCRAVGEDRKTYIGLENAVENGGQIFGYILKYTVKGNGKPEDIIFKNDQWFLEYDKQIKNIRLITPVGIYKKMLQELESHEYDFNEEMQKIHDKVKEARLKEKDPEIRKNIKASCDVYAFKKNDYIAEESELSEKEKVENAILAKTYNQFKYFFNVMTDYAKFQKDSSEKFLKHDYEANQQRIERMKKFIPFLEKKGYVIDLGNGSYADRLTGEIYKIIENKAVDNSAMENFVFDKDKVYPEQKVIDIDAIVMKQVPYAYEYVEGEAEESFEKFLRNDPFIKSQLSFIDDLKGYDYNSLKDATTNFDIEIIDDADDMFK